MAPPSPSASTLPAGTELVIFDKDGTLTDTDPCFASFLEEFVGILKKAGFYQTQNASEQHAFDSLLWEAVGFYPAERKFAKHSVMVRGSMDDVFVALTEPQVQNQEAKSAKFLLKPLDTAQSGDSVRECPGEPADEDGMKSKRRRTLSSRDEALHVLRALCPKFVATDANTATCGDVQRIFGALHERGIKVAICTRDNRDITVAMMTHLQVSPLIGDMSCGDDPELGVGKPAPDGILKICRSLGVAPERAVMVGDSVTDIQAGLSARCGKCIFVLSGGYEDAQEFWKDFVLPEGLADDAKDKIQVLASIDNIELGH